MNTYPQLGKLGLFDARVPRYTSYPTALHFNTGINSDQTRAWIRAITPGSQISLYVHIPFCQRLCWFCACRTQGTKTASPVTAYLETVHKELALLAADLPHGVCIEHLHWGGGTPTLLSAQSITDLARAITAIAPLAKDAQFSVEIDPNEIDDARLDALAGSGMNRASIGVQDFDETIQKTIGRDQTYDVTKAAVDGLRTRGIQSLNMDILYGLPHQNECRISDSVQKVLSLSPDRIALYGYAHVPWMAKRQSLIPTQALPDPMARLALFDTARDLFVWDGYDQIGIDHFARPGDGLATAQKSGRLRRNFQGYTEDTSDTLIGLGASAISRYPGGFSQNNPSTSGYQGAIRSATLATTRGHVFSHDDRIRARMIETLMCDFAIDFDALAAELDVSPAVFAKIAAGVDQAFPALVSLSKNRLSVAPDGQPLARMIARHLDAYSVSQSAHSHAV